jgi:diadenosine tetraphosphate (Ap4A) HIT family hydrolase
VSTAIHRRVEDCRAGRNATTVCRVTSGWAVLGDAQFLRGYCLLLPDPGVADLNALEGAKRAAFLRDMALIGDALLALTDAVRINYEILGNVDPALHAHVIPRYASEPEELRIRPAFYYDWAAAPRFDPVRDGPLLAALRAELERRGAAV